ncbi:hypothetical protein, partial [Mycobacterium avium]|uniref:hypothetical protein n=4 Tax=Mycobacterium TaxID=1763 RepID=UPI001E2FAE6E
RHRPGAQQTRPSACVHPPMLTYRERGAPGIRRRDPPWCPVDPGPASRRWAEERGDATLPADFRCGTTVLDVRRLGAWPAEFGGRFAAPRQLMATGKAASYCRLCSEYNTRRLDFVFRVSNDIQGTPECICGSDSSTASSALVFAGIGLLNFDFYWLASRSIFLFSA